MLNWINTKDKLPRIEKCGKKTVPVLMFFSGSEHVEKGVFYFDELTGKPYHEFDDGMSFKVGEPEQWAYCNLPEKGEQDDE